MIRMSFKKVTYRNCFIYSFSIFEHKIHYANTNNQDDMKRIFMIIILGLICDVIHAQIITKQELEKYTNIGDMSWSEKATELSHIYKLNELGELSISNVIEYEGQSKSQLYHKIMNWIISMSSDAKSAIQASDEVEGVIIARCYLPNIAKRTMGDNSYSVSIRPLLIFNFKEGRIRITYTLQNYEVLKTNDDSGYVIMFGGTFGLTGNGITKDTQIWALADCFPFADERQHPKVTSSRALIYSLSAYKILLDKIDAVLKMPLQKNDDNW